MPIDRRKQFMKMRKDRKGVYQSDQIPEHYPNEGDEFLERSPNRKDIHNDTKENADFDKMVGNRKKDKS